MEAASSELSAIRRRERPRDPRSRVSSSRESLFPGEIRSRHAPLVAEVRRPVASDSSSVTLFWRVLFPRGIKPDSAARRHCGTRAAETEMATCLEPGRAAWRGPVNARGALRGDSIGRPRRAPRPAGPPGASGERRSRSRGARLVNRARADDERDAAAAAARLAPLEASTAAGSELERILKTDPVAFERALSDQVGSPPAAPSLLRNPYSRSLRFFIFLADPPRILASRRPPARRWDARTRPERAGEGAECG